MAGTNPLMAGKCVGAAALRHRIPLPAGQKIQLDQRHREATAPAFCLNLRG
jgi:hypothetical protein